VPYKNIEKRRECQRVSKFKARIRAGSRGDRACTSWLLQRTKRQLIELIPTADLAELRGVLRELNEAFNERNSPTSSTPCRPPE
jgi:hypothetical protein